MLIVIESPKKAKKIAEYSGARVIATVGHFMDLPEKEMGIHPVSFDPDFRAGVKGAEIISKLLAASAGEDVIIATDPDREGYAIGYHVWETIKKKAKTIRRAEFREISKSAVQAAISSSIPFDKTNMGEYDAFLGRRVGDRVVGYSLSPKASHALNGPFSVGRVQSPAVMLVVAREREISAFTSTKYWDLFVHFDECKTISFKAKHKNNPFKIAGDLAAVQSRLTGATVANVIAATAKDTLQQPKPPFSTVDLQAAASAYLKMPPELTQSLAQELFAAGLCTYIRTDSYTLSAEWTVPAQGFMRQTYTSQHVPSSPIVHKAKNSQAEAHEAIRPSGVYDVANIPSLCAKEGLSDRHAQLLELIWRRAFASQMGPAVWATSQITFDINGEIFVAAGKVLKFDGFKAVWTHNDSKDEILPILSVGEQVPIAKIVPEEKKTKPIGRYSEASLLKELETKGVGRPSTFATILQSIKSRGYVEVKAGYLWATPKGESIAAWLEKQHEWVVDCGFTARMEERLDLIEGKKESWKDFIQDLIAKVGGLTAQQSGLANKTLSEKQSALVEKYADESTKKAMQAGDYKTCREWLDGFFKQKEKDSGKTGSKTIASRKSSPSKSHGRGVGA